MLLIVRLVGMVALGLAGCGSSGGSGGSDEIWGPLAVAEGSPTGKEALLSGTIEISDKCVFLWNGGERSLLVWPSKGTRWDGASRTIRYTAAGSVKLRDGDVFSVAGGGVDERSIEWAVEPDASCLASNRDAVGYGPMGAPGPEGE